MTHTVATKIVQPQLIAAVSAPVRIGEVGAKFKAPLDQVWAYLKGDGASLKRVHNLFLYHHPETRDAPMQVDFGVQVDRRFEPHGNVRAVEVPGGEIASTLHVGPYDRLSAAHQAVHVWARENRRTIGAMSWEIYGDWHADAARLETEVCYLLKGALCIRQL